MLYHFFTSATNNKHTILKWVQLLYSFSQAISINNTNCYGIYIKYKPFAFCWCIGRPYFFVKLPYWNQYIKYCLHCNFYGNNQSTGLNYKTFKRLIDGNCDILIVLTGLNKSQANDSKNIYHLVLPLWWTN